MYQESARVYDALSRHKDYVSAAATLSQILHQVVGPNVSLLDVGCGTGRHLEYLQGQFRVAGLDQSEEMLRIARQRCPGVELHLGDLCDFTMDRQFDAIICLFGSVAYTASLQGLEKALQNMVRHLRRGGALIIEPWLAPDCFVSGRLVFDSIPSTIPTSRLPECT
jgi:SAM-dependent methyltransferase